MKRYIISGLAHIAQYKWNPTEKLWNRTTVGGTSLGAAGAMTLLGQFFGISAVAHSSGAFILTGSAGYIAGTYTIGALVWMAWPLLVAIGIVALSWAWIKLLPNAFVRAFDWCVRRLYFWRNKR